MDPNLQFHQGLEGPGLVSRSLLCSLVHMSAQKLLDEQRGEKYCLFFLTALEGRFCHHHHHPHFTGEETEAQRSELSFLRFHRG